MPLNWIGARVHLGSAKSTNAKVPQWMWNNPSASAATPLPAHNGQAMVP